MSYAVRDFFANGGSQGVVVRLVNGATKAVIPLPTNALTLEAASEGAWGNNLTATVDYNTADPNNNNLFNLTVSEARGATERFLNVSGAAADARFLPRVLKQSSNLVRVQNDVVNARPDAVTTNATANSGGEGNVLTAAQFSGAGMQENKTGIYALEKADLFNLLCLPPLSQAADMPAGVYQDALAYCVPRRAMLIVDAPPDWSSANDITRNNNHKLTALGLKGDAARNAALYFPRVHEPDPLRQGQSGTFVPCGAVAGIMARTDSERGVWKAPAGIDASLNGVVELDVTLTDAENGMLNPLGVNCLRAFPVFGAVAWGARTMRGADIAADEYKYIPVRRLALYIEESLYRGTKWVVFEPNDEPLWAQIRLNVGAFMHELFRKGAFQGQTPKDAYFVKCDKETTTQNDINLGVVNILVGFAPLKPAEFVIIQIQQMAGQTAT
jgi:phage tail sheath protein FI